MTIEAQISTMGGLASAGMEDTPDARMSPSGMERVQMPGGDLIVPAFIRESSWFSDAKSTMFRFLELPRNWDSYGAKPIDPANVERALNLLVDIMDKGVPVPHLAATPSGGIQLEWSERGIDLEIETNPEGTLGVLFEDHLTGMTWEKDLGANELGRLMECVQLLSDRR